MPVRLARLLGPESALWVVLVLVVPILAVGLALTVGLTLRRLPFVDYDYWWHVATGNWILDHHRVPTTDPFSWTHGGHNWVADEWLAEVILALTVRAGGYAAAILLTTAVAVAGFWRLLRGARYYGLSRRAAGLLTLLWGGMAMRELAVRPQVWGWAMLCVVLAELAAYDTGHRRSLWILPPLFVLWINLHLTALVGIGCLGVFVLDRLVRRRLDRHLVAVGGLCLAALLVNPRGPELLRNKLASYGNPNAVRYHLIAEWKHPTLGDHSFIPFWLALPMVVPAVWMLVRRRPRLWPGLAVLALAAEGLRAIRYIPMYGILALLFAGWLVWNRAQSRGRQPAAAALPLVPRRPWAVAPPLLAAALALGLAMRHDPSQFRRTPNPHGFPAQTATVLLERYPNARLYNTYDYGGYLIDRVSPTVKVFIDGREDMYGDPFLRRYMALEAGKPGWQADFARSGVTAALVRRGDGIVAALAHDRAWRAVAGDPRAVLFVRVRSATTQSAG